MIEWDQSLVIGVKSLDEQHKALFEKVRALQTGITAGQGQDMAGDVLAFMDTYVAEHFELEEALMDSIGYPHLEAHRQEHQTFIGKSVRFELDKYADDSSLPQSMMEFFTEWLSRHIASSDKRLAAFINGNSRQARA